MIFCKVVSNEKTSSRYSQPIDVYRVVDYILDLNKCEHGVIGNNLIIGCKDFHINPQFIAEQFLTVQADMARCSRRLYHLIISFDSSISKQIKLEQIKYIAERILSLYPGYQSVYALHENTDCIHLHILFNNISIYEDFPKLSQAMYITKIENIVDEYVNDLIGIPITYKVN